MVHTSGARKCQLLEEKTVILGHVVSRDGIATEPEKVKALQQYPQPCNVSDLRACFSWMRWLLRG